MISNLYTQNANLLYPLSENGRPFNEYISQCRVLIEERRQDLQILSARKRHHSK